jgi:hypothetical protein
VVLQHVWWSEERKLGGESHDPSPEYPNITISFEIRPVLVMSTS